MMDAAPVAASEVCPTKAVGGAGAAERCKRIVIKSTAALLFFRHQKKNLLINVKSVNKRYWNSGLEKTTSEDNVTSKSKQFYTWSIANVRGR